MDHLEQLLRLDVGAFPPRYAVALAFAQHYAEAEGSPDADVLMAAVLHRYGARRTEQIMAHLAVAYVGSTLTRHLRVLRRASAPQSPTHLAASPPNCSWP